ncbi:hypothetical protein, partial [Pseudodesulfovibrio karagichevae]
EKGFPFPLPPDPHPPFLPKLFIAASRGRRKMRFGSILTQGIAILFMERFGCAAPSGFSPALAQGFRELCRCDVIGSRFTQTITLLNEWFTGDGS